MSDQQMNLAEVFLDPRMALHGKLKALSEVIDWRPLASLAARVRPGDVGRKPYEPLAMLKALYLASLYDLSDPQLEDTLIDRVSFRLFCGFSLTQSTPDETTLTMRPNLRARMPGSRREVTRKLALTMVSNWRLHRSGPMLLPFGPIVRA